MKGLSKNLSEQTRNYIKNMNEIIKSVLSIINDDNQYNYFGFAFHHRLFSRLTNLNFYLTENAINNCMFFFYSEYKLDFQCENVSCIRKCTKFIVNICLIIQMYLIIPSQLSFLILI